MSLNELKYTLQPLGATVRPLDAFHTTPDLHQQTQWGRLNLCEITMQHTAVARTKHVHAHIANIPNIAKVNTIIPLFTW